MRQTGNYYYGARYYDPRLSIFLSVDPLVEETMTPYQYCNNNPVNLVDPTGMVAEPPHEYDVYVSKGKIVGQKKVGDWGGDFMDKVNFLDADNPNLCEDNPIATRYINVQHSERSNIYRGEAGVNRGIGYKETVLDGHIDHSIDAMGINSPFFMFAGVSKTVGGLLSRSVSKELAKRGGTQLSKYSGILRDASKFKGNYGLSSGTSAEALEIGKAWVGKGFRTSKNGRFYISKNGLRQFQVPNYKPKLGKYQSNFYWKNAGQKQWQSNGHLDIIK